MFTSYPHILRYRHESALYRYTKNSINDINDIKTLIFDNVELFTDTPTSYKEVPSQLSPCKKSNIITVDAYTNKKKPILQVN